MDYVTHRNDQFHQEPWSGLSRSNSMARPSSKTIYQQRKEYSQTMASEPIVLKQRVEHLLTCKLGSGSVQEPKDVIKKLQMMDAQGQVWGQDVVLQVKDHWLQILDIETREEMDSYPLDGIQSLDAVLNSCSYNSVLLVILQELGQSLTSVLLFQCWEVGAEILKSNLQKAIDELKKRQEPRSRFGGSQPSQTRWEADPPENYLRNPIKHRVPPSSQSSTLEPQRFDQFQAQPEPTLDLERDMVNTASFNLVPSNFRHTEELNNTLSEIELLVQRAKEPQKNNTKKKILGRKKTPKGLPSESQNIECFQMIKHAFNLLGKLDVHLQDPGAPQFVHSLFSALNLMMSYCPNPHLAASVDVPRLSPQAIALMESCVTPNEMDFWQSLGEFWTNSTGYGADLESTNPTHTPRFYGQSEPSGYSEVNSAKDQDPRYPRLLPALFLSPRIMCKGVGRRMRPGKSHLKGAMRLPGTEKTKWAGGQMSEVPFPFPIILTLEASELSLTLHPHSPSPVPKPLLMQVQYEFESRNPRELTVVQGEVLEILDNSKQWWLVKNEAGQRGYIPNNILEPLPGPKRNRGRAGSPIRGPMLRPTSKPQEVRAWLEAENFSSITVKTLGMLTGSQLLHMKPRELQLVCPEDAPQILARLEEVKMVLGMGP
ncbi:epidermal growth factor receptor kinase substrate 8-like protein 3 [Dromiciops gliroides]|uniref:epidermal growth factor receptor kinase substrate 8-like protein 3 n=1 Tax=Dromiciops gliroides TaxID=33562 RepID=UPI001CC614F3|nr:epidermal growth factor receptor kinase substrate 8-like protein 3 [Dromiciops gliroides]